MRAFCGAFDGGNYGFGTHTFARAAFRKQRQESEDRASFDVCIHDRRSVRRMDHKFPCVGRRCRPHAHGRGCIDAFAYGDLVRRSARDIPEKTFGYYRLEILAAFVNGIALVLLSIWIIYEAVGRWQSPPEIKGISLTLIAIGGLAVNVIAAFLLHTEHKHDLNLRGAWLHVMGDILGSVAAITAGVLIVALGWLWADAVGSVLIS
jgi:hypothetical protein